MLTLGELIEQLERVENKDSHIQFDFCGAVPTVFDSYRGFYEQLALGYQECERSGNEHMTAAALLQLAQNTLAQTFTGWKGGEYEMHHDTPVWVDNPGCCFGTAIVGVKDERYHVVLLTSYEGH